MLSKIHGHTVDESLLTNGVVIDIGCRDFQFASHFKTKTVYCVDPDKEIFRNIPPNVIPVNRAVSNYNGESSYYRNGEMTALTEIYKGWEHERYNCNVITLSDLYAMTGRNIDLLKLDCEGSEYYILDETFEPIPKMVSVEFHRHMYPELHDKMYDKVLDTLLLHYNLVYQHETLMDNLFVRK